jgi:polyphosphate kinase 2 (PPK2 family)
VRFLSDTALGWYDSLRRLLRTIENHPVPVIVMIEGGACEAAMACEIIVAAPIDPLRPRRPNELRIRPWHERRVVAPAWRLGGNGSDWRGPTGISLEEPSQMKTADFIVDKRPRLAAIEGFPKVDLSDYERRLSELQETLQRVQQAYLGTPQRAVIVLEGWDTAGKGGVVRRLGWALDPRSFKVAATAAPGGREKSLHYLQRFWERLPEHGQIVAFDRSWYGRVLVERVEGFAAPAEWRRAYKEINEFEAMLLDDGVRLVKLFMHITPDEQMRRFQNRLTNPLKRWSCLTRISAIAADGWTTKRRSRT